MAQTAYWAIGATSGWSTPTGAQIRLQTVTGGSVYGSESAPGSGSGTITESTLVTTLPPSTGYTLAWTVYDDVALTYATPVEATFNTATPAVDVPAASLTLTGYAPTVTATANQTVSAPAGALTLTGYAPSITAGGNQTVDVPVASLTLTGNVPTVTATAHQIVSAPAGALTLTGHAPTVNVDASRTVDVPAGTLTLTVYAPTVTATGHQVISVPAGALYLSGYEPTVTNGEVSRIIHEVDMESPLWWKRKPKKVSDEEAAEKVAAVAKVIKAKAQEHAEQIKPAPKRKAEVKREVAPLVAEMPGFDWKPLYQQAYDDALTRAIANTLEPVYTPPNRVEAQLAQQAQEMAAREIERIRMMDDEDVALLAMFI